jgi:tetratricopeptide (TPR) repeat protein
LGPAGSGQWYQLATAYLALGQREDYRKVCAEMLKRYHKTKEPDWAGRILYACLPTADALADMSALIPLTEAVANGKPDARALGAALYRTRKYEEAIVKLNEGNQDRAWDNLFLAMAHHHLGNAEEARAYLKVAVQRIEYSDYPWTERVESEALCREAELLILGTSTHRPALTAERSTARARVRSGNTLRANGQPDAATAEYRKAIKLDPQYAPAHLFLGLALSQKGDDAGAVTAYESTREIDATIACNELAWILATSRDASLRDPHRAVKLAREAVALEPRNGSNWNTLGAAQYRAGDWKAAIAALERSVKLQKGGDCTDWFFLAMAHKQLNKRDKARRWCDQAVQWMDKHAPPDQFLRALGAEAKALMQGHDREPTKK